MLLLSVHENRQLAIFSNFATTFGLFGRDYHHQTRQIFPFKRVVLKCERMVKFFESSKGEPMKFIFRNDFSAI
jgi:Gpi18-like mannosyltransferase